MHQPGVLGDLGIEDSSVVRGGHHDPGRSRRDRRLERVDPYLAGDRVRVEADHLVSRRGRGRGVARMRHRTGDDLVPEVLIARVVIGADHTSIGVGAMTPAAGLEGDLVHAAQLAEPVAHGVHDLEHALERLLRLQGVQVGELGQAGQLLVEPWRVLHRAGADPDVAARVVPEGHLGAADVVPQDLGLGQLGHRRWHCPPRLDGQAVQHRRRLGGEGRLDSRQDVVHRPWPRLLVERLLVPAHGSVPGVDLLVGSETISLDRGVRQVFHRITSSRVRTSRSISDCVRFSVTQ